MKSKHIVLLLAIASVFCSYEATAQTRKSPAQAASEAKQTEFKRKAAYSSTVAAMARQYTAEAAKAEPLLPLWPQKSHTWSVPYAPILPAASSWNSSQTGVIATFVGRTTTAVRLSCPDGSQVYVSLAALTDYDRDAIAAALRPLPGTKGPSPAEGSLGYAPPVGTTGSFAFGSALITQVISKNSGLIDYQYYVHRQAPDLIRVRGAWVVNPARGNGAWDVKTYQALLSGVDLSAIADNTSIALPGLYTVTGTYAYETAIGARRTVLVIAPAKPSTNAPAGSVAAP
jgi:hypothetical protein